MRRVEYFVEDLQYWSLVVDLILLDYHVPVRGFSGANKTTNLSSKAIFPVDYD